MRPEAPEGGELTVEQTHLDHAYACLAAMQERAADVRAIGDRAVRDENTVEARIAQFHLARREAALAEGRGPLCFGRIDTDDGDRWYVGRRHVEDDEARPVVTDWRAPVSAAFYRATAVDPCGLSFRRRFIVDDRRITDLLDEHLDDPDSVGGGGLPDPLLAELERSRTGQMRDIVATIAAEQDEIIRAPLSELLVVQGGPGTGKTAVGLHRAAFLLFEHRETLVDKRVLIVGPNPLFLRYIAEVLPSLGERAVTQATLDGLVAARYRVRAEEGDDVARLKGRVEMAAVVAAAARHRITPASDGIELRAGLARVRVEPDELEQLQKTVLGRRLPINQGREVFRQLIVQHAWRRHRDRPGVDPGSEPLFTSGVRQDRGFKAAVDKMWPTLSPPVLVRSLYSSPKRLQRAAEGVLDGDEVELLRRTVARKAADEPWTLGDLPLLDEAESLIAGVPATYGHVVVDEAQDLSPMALRMLARRADRGSMTILGDLAQATSPQACGSWRDAVAVLTDQAAEMAMAGERPRVAETELTVGYRVPASIIEVANRLLPTAAPGVTPVRAVRPGGDAPLVLAVEAGAVAGTVASEAAALRERSLSVAVVALDHRLGDLAAALDTLGVGNDLVGASVGLPGHDAVALVAPAAVKGLEFDAVVVVEPAEIVGLENGLRHLYVALTRAVQHLGIVHAHPLPEELAGA